jgi:DNA-binding LacI/PurR family transcriptional regulator
MRCGPEHLFYGMPRLTTVDVNIRRAGRLAMDLLLRRMAGDRGPQQVHHISPELIVGETTLAAAREDRR